jgi:hypothetical protein
LKLSGLTARNQRRHPHPRANHAGGRSARATPIPWRAVFDAFAMVSGRSRAGEDDTLEGLIARSDAALIGIRHRS